MRTVAAILFAVMSLSAAAGADDADIGGSRLITHELTGLSCKERCNDLEWTLRHHPEIIISSIDFSHARVTFYYDPALTPTGRLDNFISLRGFNIRNHFSQDHDKLTKLQIPVAGIDCRGCSLGAYNALSRLEGVEQTFVDFKAGLVTAWIDPAKIQRPAIEKALTDANVSLLAAKKAEQQ